jgi:hypothetical protein
MKLDQKQMHVVSQLFMAAGKAGHAFDLARFTRESSYASETLAQLSIAADNAQNESLNSWVLMAMDVMTATTTAATATAATTSASASTPNISIKTLAPQQEAPSGADTQYVGRLR